MPRDTCPVCRHDLEVPARYVAKTWRCPDCRTAFVPCAPPGVARRRARLSDGAFIAAIAALLAALLLLFARR
jgi:hypothetical protein